MEVSSNELIVFPPELKKMENIVFGLSQDNIQESVESIFKFIDRNFLRSYNLIICQLVYSFLVARKVDNLYINFDFLKAIEMKENSIILNQKYIKITVLFGMYLWLLPTQEAYYILEKMSYEHIIPPETLRKHKSNHFAHYKSKEELKRNAFSLHQLQLDNFKQFKSLIHEGVNPLTVARIIRNDEIEKLQEISSQTNFDINQTIEPSFYERCSFINKENVTLIDYAAFFSAVKCFKYLLEKGANVLNTGKLAIAGGNNKIIKLCIKNHSSFKGSYESSIKFHQNEIFKYLYKTKIRKDIDFKKLFRKCVKNNNYEILSYLGSNGYQACNIDDDLIYEIASNGNIFLFKSLISVKQIPKDILVYASKSINTELLKYILQQKFDINEKRCLFVLLKFRFSSLKFYKYIWNLFVFFRTALYVASSKGNIDVVKFLLDQNGINVNAIRGYFDYGVC